MWARYGKIGVKLKGDCPAGEYVATEKLHGANFSCVYSRDGQVSFAKRSGVTSEDFFGFRSQGLHRSLASAAERLFKEAESSVAEQLASVVVYGELVGGHYPHPDVEAVRGLRAVQNGVWYSPGLIFVAFDLRITPMHGVPRFVNFDVARATCLKAGLHFVHVRARGPYNVLLDEPVQFQTALPRELGLPPIHDNFAEGLVLRPAVEPAPEHARMDRGLVKAKVPFFDEIQYTNADWKVAKQGAGGTAYAEPSSAELVVVESQARACQQRLDSVLSKLGRLQVSRWGAFGNTLAAFEEDVADALVDDGVVEDRAALQDLRLAGDIRAACRQVLVEYLREEARRTEATADGNGARERRAPRA